MSQEFDSSNVLDLVKPKEFYPHECMSDFEKFNEKLPSKEKFHSPLINKKISDNEYKHFFKTLEYISNENIERLSRFV